VLAAIPQVWVGPEEHLILLVNFLCAEMSAAFRQLGSVPPPWRQASSMLSKWRPRNSIDMDSQAGGANARRCGAVGGVSGAVTGPPADNGGVMVMGREWQCPIGPPQQRQGPYPGLCKAGFAQPQPQLAQPLHHWQEAARVQQQQQQPVSLSGMRPRYEPQRVVFGGNFVPVAPSPALA
jgi:hypothetical protein